MAPSALSEAQRRQRMRATLWKAATSPDGMEAARDAKARLFDAAVDPLDVLDSETREKRAAALARVWYLELAEEKGRRLRGEKPRHLRLRDFLARATDAARAAQEKAKPPLMTPEEAASLEEARRVRDGSE